MKSAEILALAAGLAVGALVFKAYRMNTHRGAASPAGTDGVMGGSAILNPAAPKTTGDFARYDRAVITPQVIGYHDPVYDAPAQTVTGYHDPVYGESEVPNVAPSYEYDYRGVAA
jgi:hypothetical protein